MQTDEKKNYIKHSITKKESEEVFFNRPVIFFEDFTHSTIKEKRYYALGKTNKQKLLTVVFTIRDKKIRVISSRPMGKKEQKLYK